MVRQRKSGKGGYGVVMISGNLKKEFSQGYLMTTNNRMELLAVIIALEKIKKTNSEVVVYSDSKYVVDSIEKKWVFSWETKNLIKKRTGLMDPFLKVFRKHFVKFVWIKGHNNNKYNERCDFLAVSAAEGDFLKKDIWYENNVINKNELF